MFSAFCPKGHRTLPFCWNISHTLGSCCLYYGVINVGREDVPQRRNVTYIYSYKEALCIYKNVTNKLYAHSSTAINTPKGPHLLVLFQELEPCHPVPATAQQDSAGLTIWDLVTRSRLALNPSHSEKARTTGAFHLWEVIPPVYYLKYTKGNKV